MPLTPLGLIFYTAAFAGCLALTVRRPVYGLAALLACLPIAVASSVSGTTITLPKVLLLAVLTGSLPRLRLLARMRAARPMFVAFGVMVTAIILTLVPSTYHANTLRETAKWIEYGLLFAVVLLNHRGTSGEIAPARDDAVLRGAIFASILVVCVSALAQELIGSPWQIVLRGAPATRIAGVLEGPNQLAAYLEVAIATVLAWNLRAPTTAGRWLLAVAACTLVLTFSRAGIACAALAVAVILAFDRERPREVLPALAGACCGGAGVAAWWITAPQLWHQRAITWAYSGGLGDRSELWRAALFFFRHHPLLGIGAGNYELELPRAGVYGVRTHANNWCLQALAEGGIVLFAATIGWIATTFASLARDARRSPWRLAALAASVALVVHQCADYLVFYPKVAEPWIALIALGML